MNSDITIEYLKEGVTKEYDLDGHGFSENIYFFLTSLNKRGNLLTLLNINVENSSSDDVLDCNDEPADCAFNAIFEKQMAIVTVPGIAEKLLILSGVDSMACPVSEVFMYKGGKVRYLGRIEGTLGSGSLRIENDGTFFANVQSEYIQDMYYVVEYVIHRNELVPIDRWMYPITTLDSNDEESFVYVTKMDYEFYEEPCDDSDQIEIPEGTEVTMMTTSETGWFEIDVDGESYYFYMTTDGEVDGDEDFTIDMLFDGITMDD